MPVVPVLPSAAKRGRGSMQRQLSLQVSASAALPERRNGLRRQSSEDLSLRIGSGKAEKGQDKSRPAITRPRQVRMAWGERKAEESDGPVEVIARRCAGLPRPTSRTHLAPKLFEAQPHNLSRQQLAERLRRAWKDRDIKPNLEIVLAHSRPESSTTARSEDTLSTARTPVRGVHTSDFRGRNCFEGTPRSSSSGRSDDSRPDAVPFSGRQGTTRCENFGEPNILGNCNEPTEEKKLSANFGRCTSIDVDAEPVPQELSNSNVGFTSVGKNSAVPCFSPTEPHFKPKMFLCTTPFTNLHFEKEDSSKENLPPSPLSSMSASERRASFKSSQLLNRTINGSFSDDFHEGDGGGFKVFLTKSRPPLQRTSSAPTERTKARSPSPAKVLKPTKVDKKTVAVFRESPCSGENNQKAVVVPRKKLRNPPMRRKPRDESSDEEDSIKTDAEKKKTPPRRRPMPKECFGGEIITMVSLVSPAESDEDEPILTLPLTPPESFADEAEEKPPEIAKESDADILLQKCIALRKPIKTVSFQAHPPVSRSCSASYPMRRAPPGAPIIVPAPITSHPISTSDRQQDRGVKRRMMRSKTLPVKDDEDLGSSDERSDTPTEPSPAVVRPQPANEPKDVDDVSCEEPEIKSPKEKECWALYKKMVDKGVAVSYDTILR